MKADEAKTSIVRYWWSKAEESLASAERELQAGMLTLTTIHRARAAKNRLDGRSVKTDEEAAAFVAARGFCLLMPLRGVPLPSLSQAEGGAVWADDFRCTDRAWAWKETLPGRKLCAYVKLIRHRGTFIGWRLYPAFLALYGAGDLDDEYEAGRISRAERELAALVAERGPIDTRELWRLARPLFGGARHRFLAALERLQTIFVVTVAGGSLEGWSRHTWDLVERWVPPEVLAKLPTRREARRVLLWQTLSNCVAAEERLLCSLLGWPAGEVVEALDELAAAGMARRVRVEGQRGPWWACDN
ncbi:MAG: winged helix DNA-binding domain-containing protein [Firmicutes bacterium]|nr:winged helix DNA-binding domain-containing protein [Bacillota bacterium]